MEQAEASPSETNAKPPAVLPLLWDRLPLLPPDVHPSGWQAAQEAWQKGIVAYREHQMEQASLYFLKAAENLRVAKNHSAAERVSITGRCLAYENAGRALRAGHNIERAQAVLQEAALIDPACKHSVSIRIAHLIRAHTTTTSFRRAGP